MARGALIRVRGQVQGVGFRPHVWRVAQALMARGEVLKMMEGTCQLANMASGADRCINGDSHVTSPACIRYKSTRSPFGRI